MYEGESATCINYRAAVMSNLGTFLFINDMVNNYVSMGTGSHHYASIFSMPLNIFESKP